jgi:hypothetical protein
VKTVVRLEKSRALDLDVMVMGLKISPVLVLEVLRIGFYGRTDVRQTPFLDVKVK